MERIDKIIASKTEYSRKDVKRLIQQNRIKINNETIKNPELKIDIANSLITIDGNDVDCREFVYLVLNKPQGYISATEDKFQQTILDLIPEKYKNRNLFPVGRLDKDTTGLILLTDDGSFAHDIVSPKKHVSKTYRVKIDIPVNQEMIDGFRDGITLNDGKCKPASLEKVDEFIANVIITEGKYHQIKRMFGCFGAKVLELERIKIGEFELPTELKTGECREISENEINLIKARF